MRYVIKYTKDSSIKFISHLDLMRTIQRVIRRTGLPIQYSKGFNPHMAVAMAQPLSVGVYSEGEYMDIVLVETLPEEEILERLNQKSADGIKFTWAKSVEMIPNQKNLPQTMALVDAARFTIKIKATTTEALDEKVRELLNQPEWVTLKKSKKGEKEVDIKPMIKEFKYWVKDEELVINALMSSGSREHLSPDLVASYIKEKIQVFQEEAFVDIKREEMYIDKNNKLVPLYKGI